MAESVIIDSTGDIMIRTQISFEESEYPLAKKEAKSRGISLSELVRRSLRRSLPMPGKAPWLRYAGFIESGDPKASQKVDEMVYG
jgi:hypothetical protein